MVQTADAVGPIVLAHNVNGAVSDVLDDLARHVIGPHVRGGVVFDSHALKRRSVGHAQGSATHVDAVRASRTTTLRRSCAGRPSPPSTPRGSPNRRGRPTMRPAQCRRGHARASRYRNGAPTRSGRCSQLDLLERVLDLGLQEGRGPIRGACVVDQQPDVEAIGRRGHLGTHIGIGEILDNDARLHPVLFARTRRPPLRAADRCARSARDPVHAWLIGRPGWRRCLRRHRR